MSDHRAYGHQSVNTPVKAPETLFQFFWLTIKGFVQSFPKTFVKQLVKMGILFAGILLVHAYLVVVKNEGFGPDPNNPYLPMVAMHKYYQTAMGFWAFAGFLVSTVLARIGRDGVPTFLKEVGGAPLWLVHSLAMTGLAGIYRLLQWTAVGLLLALLVRNPFTLWLYALMLFFSFTARAKGVHTVCLKYN